MSYGIRTSLWGRRFGLGSSDQIIDPQGARLDSGRINSAVSTSGATIGNSGLTPVGSTATAANFLLEAPTEGCRVELYFTASSSLVTIAAATSAFTIGTSSTGFTVGSTAVIGVKNIGVMLRGLGTTAYAMVANNSSGAGAVVLA